MFEYTPDGRKGYNQEETKGRTELPRLCSAVPESSVRCRSCHSNGIFSHSQDAELGNYLLGRHRHRCNLWLTRPHRERLSFCPHQGRFPQTTVQDGQRTLEEPPEGIISEEWRECYEITKLLQHTFTSIQLSILIKNFPDCSSWFYFTTFFK